MKTKIAIAVLVLLIVIQFIPVSLNQSEDQLPSDFIALQGEAIPAEISSMLKTSCYDCHSNNTSYPWYNKIAPVSWYLKKHVNNGKKHLNFSTWGDYDAGKKAHKIEEIVEWVSDGEMPLSTYTLMHGDAKLSDTDRTQLVDYFKSL